MIKLSHATLIVISGLLWSAIGISLMYKGVSLMAGAVAAETHQPLLGWVASIAGDKADAATVLLAVALVIGFFKGRFVLAKSVRRVVTRIRSFPNPTQLTNLYSRAYYILLASMMLLGVGMNVLQVPGDVRAVVDLAIGWALVNGALQYFRQARVAV